MLRRLHEVYEFAPVVPQDLVEMVRLAPLDFYPGWLLCDFQVHAAEDASVASTSSAPFGQAIFSYLYGPDGFTGLSGYGGLFRDHNIRHGVDLRSARKRCNYLRFYCFFVRGDEGPFEIVEADDLLDFGDGRNPVERKALRAAVRPIRESQPTGQNEAARREAHAYEACMHYGRTLFSARFALYRSGLVEMVDDEPLGHDVLRVPTLGFSGCARFPLATARAPERPEA